MRDGRRDSDRLLGHLAQPWMERRDRHDDSVVMTLTLSVNKTTRSGKPIAIDRMSVSTCRVSCLPYEIKMFPCTWSVS